MLGFGLVWLVDRAVRGRSRCGGSAATTSRTRATASVVFGGWVAARRRVRAPLRRRARRDGPRAAGCRDRWWIPARGVLRRPQRAVLVRLRPYLVPARTRSGPRAGARRAARIAEQEGVDGVPIRVQDVHDRRTGERVHDRASARRARCSSGTRCSTAGSPSGRSRSSSRTSSGTRRANHLLKGLAWYALFTVPARVPDRGGRPAARRDAASRRRSRSRCSSSSSSSSWRCRSRRRSRATWRPRPTGWRSRRRATRRRRSGCSGASRPTSLSDPNPPTAPYLVFDDHPTLMQRIAMARAWAAAGRRRTLAGVGSPAGS